MLSPPTTRAADREWLAYLSFWARSCGRFVPYPMGGGFHTPDHSITVEYERGGLLIEVREHPRRPGRRLVAEVDSMRTVLDLLYAFDVVPVQFSSAYAVGTSTVGRSS